MRGGGPKFRDSVHLDGGVARRDGVELSSVASVLPSSTKTIRPVMRGMAVEDVPDLPVERLDARGFVSQGATTVSVGRPAGLAASIGAHIIVRTPGAVIR